MHRGYPAVGPARRGAGSIPASCRICHTVDAAIWWPSLTSSPCTRRCPHAGLSVAMRITSLRTAVAVGGRPGCRRLVAGNRIAASGTSVPGEQFSPVPGRCVPVCPRALELVRVELVKADKADIVALYYSRRFTVSV